MSYSSYARGASIESDPIAVQSCIAQIKHWIPNVVRIERVEDKKRQLVGIDYVAFLADGTSKTIDVKVRKAGPKFWSKRNSYSQDVIIEHSQSGKWGWANNPSYVTDFVLWVWPWMTASDSKIFKKSIMCAHKHLKKMVDSGSLDDLQERKTMNESGCYSYYRMVTIRRLLDEVG